MNLDIKNRKILYELDKNARASLSYIGKKVGLSSEVVHYRIKRLENKGIITGYHSLPNFNKLGLIHFKICIKFNGIPLKKEEEFYAQVKKIPQVIWIASCRGEWDCFVSSTVKDLFELDQIKDKIISMGDKYILNKTISVLTDYYSQPRDFLVSKKRISEFKKLDTRPAKLDEIDLKILRVLSENSRVPIITIAQKAKTTVKTVANRIRKLLKEQVIINFRPIIDYDKIGLNFFKTFIYIKNPDKERVNLLWNDLKKNPNVIHNLKVVGEWDMEPEFEFENEADFGKLIQYLMDNYSDIIQRISVIDIVKEYKFTFFYK
ncbi:Lrp/AsnC family transcriptional regulator [Candidatus Woesearchaeota archaeon]|nr:Lrp/AsnC family transcriptional regulator [Candidatus Woesearchaeota archaeon]MBW3017650.1 Lrp/AsnC family transcriptional regulator [Candidatus Woesearchaeota archaeon]